MAREKFKKIKLTQGKYALVDYADYFHLIQYSWHYKPSDKTGYASRSVYTGVGLSPKTRKMHQDILGFCPGKVIDHINRNGLDNRRKNLRFVDFYENVWNRGVFKGKTQSKYPGVTKTFGRSGHESIIARVGFRGKRYYLGTFKTELAAHRAICKFAKKVGRST